MGLLSGKGPCPVCGGEVTGPSPVRIGGRKALCRNCSRQISMNRSLLENAAPELIREHLEYRRKNAEKYAAHRWTSRFTSIPGLQVGVDKAGEAFYLVHRDLHDSVENPVVFSFDQLTGYELFRRKRKLDGSEGAGGAILETGLGALEKIARLVNGGRPPGSDSFRLRLTTTDPYWAEIDLKIEFAASQLHGFGGFAGEMARVCHLFKSIIRKEPLYSIR